MKPPRGYYDVFVKACATYPSHIAVRYYNNEYYEHYTYSEMYGVCEYISQNLQQLTASKGVVGIITDRNIIVPSVIAAAHKWSTIFMFLDPKQDLEKLDSGIHFNVIISVRHQDIPATQVPLATRADRVISIFGFILTFYSISPCHNKINKLLAVHSYITSTSGSTGEPKHIQVPIQCLQPNINDLTKLFDMSSNDIIYFSTPLTFDPSMVEILLACKNGASLLIAPDRAEVLFPINKGNAITFWQTTPSRFFQYSNEDMETKILSANSSLKILALGGEPLIGIRRLRELKHSSNTTKIYTLYGVSEMSCWACAAELDLDKVINDKEVPLGNCLSETQLIIEPIDEESSTGKIILVSNTRKCIVVQTNNASDESSLKFIDTGDMAEVKSGTVYYRGRRDDVIKRFGNKVSLQHIESTTMQCPEVRSCSCVWIPKPMLLVVYFTSETISTQVLSDFLKCKLDDKQWPDKVIKVNSIPTNAHGKVSKKTLLSMYEEILESPSQIMPLKDQFLRELQTVMSRDFSYDEVKDKDFFALGGTSFLAISMCNKISQRCPKFGKFILPYMITPKKTVGELIKLAEKELHIEELNIKKRIRRSGSIPESQVIKKKMSPEFLVLWTHDTGKCVDASPVLYQNGENHYVIVGSHSGIIIVMDAVSGALKGSLSLKSRVEAPILCYDKDPLSIPCGVVGSYDGIIVCFILEDCKEIWRINIDCMIKSKAACCNGSFYVAAYDGKVRCIDALTGDISSIIPITDQPISADLVLAKNQYIVLGTLSGMCASIHVTTNSVAWRGTLGSPVFASPALYHDENYVLFAEVNGEIHCRTVDKGIKLWRYGGAKGNIFSSLYITGMNKLNWKVIFGCYDHKIYCINIRNFQPTLQWTAQLSSPAYSTPCGLNDKFVVAASNDGKLYLIESSNGAILAENIFPNETFSSPVVYDNNIFIGCRNDKLYALTCIVK